MPDTRTPELSATYAQAPLTLWSVAVKGATHAPVQVLAGDDVFAQFAHAAPDWSALAVKAACGAMPLATHRAPDGTWVTRFTCTPQKKADAVLVHAVTLLTPHAASSASDANVRLRAREDERLRVLLAGAPAAIAMLQYRDAGLYYTFTNTAYEHLVGQNNLAGKPMGSAFPKVARQAPELLRILFDVAKTGMRQEAKEFGAALDWQHDGHVSTKYFDVVCEPIVAGDTSASGVSLFAYDVTPQVAARRQAEEREAHFRHLADCLPQIVWTANPAGTLDYFNARWFPFRGLSPSDPMHTDWASLVHPEDAEMGRQKWAECLSNSSPLDMELRMRNADGFYRWFLIKALPVFNPQGGVWRWFGSSTDVHEHKNNAHKLQQILENMNEGFVLVDADWHILQANVRHEVMSRMPRSEQLGKSFLDLFFPKGHTNHAAERSYRRAMKERVKSSFDFYSAPLDLPVVVNLYPDDAGGLSIFYRDNKQEYELRNSMEAEKNKFEAIFVDSPASMALLRGEDLVFEKFNRNYTALIGHRDLAEKPLLAALPELTGKPFLGLLQNVLATGVPYVAHEASVFLLRRPGGQPEEMFLNFTYTRVTDGDNKPYGVYIHADDVSEKVVSRQRVEKLNINLQNAIRARDDFLSSASHELKTPLTSIKMQLQMTRRHVKVETNLVPTPQKLAKTLDQCCRQVDRLTALIEDLLDVSRIEAGKMSFEFAPTDMVALVQECLAQFTDQFLAAKCDLEVQLPAQLEIVCDSFRVEQVVINLLSNAVKYAAGSHVQVRLHQLLHAGVRLTVTDCGMGIALDKMDKIFSRFERAITHKNVSGLGLGLYICHEIITAHRGQIDVQSVLGKGSTFTVDLPQDPRTEL